MSATRLAVDLDTRMLFSRSVPIADEMTADVDLRVCTDLAVELGGRLLVMYIRDAKAKELFNLSPGSVLPGMHYATPTPIAAADLSSALNLPPLPKPRRSLLLDPGALTDVRGPRRIAGGFGLEYIIFGGLARDAIALPGWAQVHP